MRKRKSVKKTDDDSDGSEPGGEPEEFQDSGEDWTPDADPVSIECIQILGKHFVKNSVLLT